MIVFYFRTDPHVILTLEKAIMRGKPVLLRNCEEHIDNIITPLMHHRNTANEDDRNEGMCDWVEVVEGRGGARTTEEL